MRECKWMQEGICVNEDCPMFCGCCPVEDEPKLCGYAEQKEVQGEKYAYITYECHRCKRKTSRKIDMSSVSGEDIARLRLDICPICGAKMMKEKTDG